ncbi:response regulator [Bremerella cremea]|uniref:response regulator n=1 Tax=Bremerella cremea TaxID=1031537 RepID=UPI0031F136AE
MRTILFVDDEPNVLSGLRRTLRQFRGQWALLFANGAEEAVSILRKRKLDVIVTDMQMPRITGAQLLKYVGDKYPDIVRVMLSGQSDEESLQLSVSRTHQYFTKPCDPVELFQAVSRSCALRDRLSNEKLKALISQTRSLPSAPQIYAKVVDELQSTDACLRTIADLISQDVAMSTKLLQLVNSSFFSLKRRVESPAQAAALLGLNVLRPVVLTVGIFSQFDVKNESLFSMGAFSDHAMAVGQVAEMIAEDLEAPKQMVDDSQMAGFVHDVGQLLLASRMPEIYEQMHRDVVELQHDLYESEDQYFGTTHLLVGAHLLALWGLPQPIVEAVAFHAKPREMETEEFNPLVAVHVANVLVNETTLQNPIEVDTQLDLEWLDGLGLADHVDRWRDRVRVMVSKGGRHE